MHKSNVKLRFPGQEPGHAGKPDNEGKAPSSRARAAKANVHPKRKASTKQDEGSMSGRRIVVDYYRGQKVYADFVDIWLVCIFLFAPVGF